VSRRLSEAVSLDNERISAAEADRQRRTAAAILDRFDEQPGVVLADEVGLGKTYVALAVAVSVATDPSTTGPVVVMVPPSVGDKWPREWATFQSKCLKQDLEIRATAGAIRSGSEFLKLLDDPADRAHDIIFLTHGALTGSLTDPLVRLAIVRRALRRKSLTRQREAFPRWVGRVIPRGWELSEELVGQLLAAPPSGWRRAIKRVTDEDPGDDPVPRAVVDALEKVDLSRLVDACEGLPLRTSARLESRLNAVKRELRAAIADVWREALSAADLHLPLLILDEAHHAKNPGTRLARLFADSDQNDASRTLKGPFAGVFDRMLFLTATPLQLAHRELIEILRRFEGVRRDDLDREAYTTRIDELEAVLDSTQAASLRLDRAWNSLTLADLVDAPERWWSPGEGGEVSETLTTIGGHVAEVRERTRRAERLLRESVIRHSRPERDERRSVHCGRAIVDLDDDSRRGLEIGGPSTLPFLLAARAQALVLADERRGGPRGRALFAEGLASSFEAYAQTRGAEADAGALIDDPDPGAISPAAGETEWYLDQIAAALPKGEHSVWREHPKIAATSGRAVELWQRDEKVLIFCYFRATGRALRDHISRDIDRIVIDEARRQLGREVGDEAEVREELRRRRERFFDPDAPVTKIARSTLRDVLDRSVAPDQVDDWIAVMLRFLGTGTFLVRHVGLGGDAAGAFEDALSRPDGTSRSLRGRLESFATFLGDRTPEEQLELLDRLAKLASGTGERDGEIQLPNVRLANGEVERETRERLMAGFNTPFFPDILIASSVMAEGVDLHLNCRHVIHHDLDWNPSVIEQRTGRLDRIGSAAEQEEKPVIVFEPFLEATQDEKMFRVMKDRERWFNVVMGAGLDLDEWSTEKLSDRVPLPSALAAELTLDLSLRRRPGGRDQGAGVREQ
jgi:hypothetical protein